MHVHVQTADQFGGDDGSRERSVAQLIVLFQGAAGAGDGHEMCVPSRADAHPFERRCRVRRDASHRLPQAA
jgi:hypothetical protein